MDDLDDLEDMLNDLEGGSDDLDDLDDLLDEIAPTYKPHQARNPKNSHLNIAEQQSAFTRPPNSDGQGGEMNTWDP